MVINTFFEKYNGKSLDYYVLEMRENLDKIHVKLFLLFTCHHFFYYTL